MTTTPGPECLKPSVHPYAEHDGRVAKHYAHAREKHPYFCDMITCMSKTSVNMHLKHLRSILAAGIEYGCVEASTVLSCEIYEAFQAYARGDTAHAVEECYDAIAVLLRTIDVLEGRQKLGRPKNVHNQQKKGIVK